MQIPTGDWVVVMRHCRDTRSPGEVIKYLIPEPIAKTMAQLYQHDRGNWNYWAMPLHKYQKPYSEES